MADFWLEIKIERRDFEIGQSRDEADRLIVSSLFLYFERLTMKIIYAIVPMFIALCGCDKSSHSNEQLESRVSVLEKNLVELRGLNQSNLTAMQNNFMTASGTNFQAFDAINHQLVIDNNRIEFMQTVVSNLINTINQQVVVMSQQNNSQVAPTVQIPANVLDQIRAGAIQQFPNDLSRQNDMIKQETDAWRKLNQ